MINIDILGGSPGCGKTTQYLSEAYKLALSVGQLTVVCVPTIDLSNQNHNRILEMNTADRRVRSVEIHGDSACKQLSTFLENVPLNEGVVLHITHANFKLNEFWPNADKWNLIIDEDFGPIGHLRLNLSRNLKMLDDLVALERIDDNYSKITLNEDKRAQAEAMYRNRFRDDVDSALRTPLSLINYPDKYDLVTNTDNWIRVKTKAQSKKDSMRSRQVNLYYALRPEFLTQFNKVTLVGADIEDSLMYNVWKDKVTFNITNIGVPKHYAQTEIHYLSRTNISGTRVNHFTDTHWNKIEAELSSVMGGDPFVYSLPNKIKRILQGDRMKVMVQGLNTYRNYDHVVGLSVTKPSPPYTKFMESYYKIEDTRLREILNHSIIHQQNMRCSIRNVDGDLGRHIIWVWDLELASYIHARLPGSHIHDHNIV